ncbi:MAG: methyltransferase domain-containing protein [Halieaceae bacterium]
MALNSIDICTQLETWFESPRGRHLLQQEQQLASTLLNNVFGYHQLQLGVTRNQQLAPDSQLGHKVYSNAFAGHGVGLLSEPDSLPFADDSIDAIVLQHALDFAANPHGLLREAHRVLAHQGQIIVLGFNPASLFGINMRVRGLWPGRLWNQAHLLGVRRLRDWLRLLGAEVHEVQHCFSVPPLGGDRIFKALGRCDQFTTRHNVPLGGVYAIRAQKQLSTLTPTRLRWQRKMGARLIGLAVPKPVPSPRAGEASTREKSW